MTKPVIDRAAIDALIRDAQEGVAHVPVGWLEALRELMPDSSLAEMLANALQLAESEHGAQRQGRRVRCPAAAGRGWPAIMSTAVLAGGCPRQLRLELDLPTPSDAVAFSNALRACVLNRAEVLADLVFEFGDLDEPELREHILTMADRLDAIEIGKRGRPGAEAAPRGGHRGFSGATGRQTRPGSEFNLLGKQRLKLHPDSRRGTSPARGASSCGAGNTKNR